MNSNPERRHDVDWLRVLAVLLLIYFHSAVIFSTGKYYVKNEERSLAMTVFVTFVSQWHMPLFFLIAGAATRFSLDRRTGRQYVRERFKRLFIPFIFGTLVIVPPQVYYLLRSNPQYHDSYFQFYPHFFTFDFATPGYAGTFEWGHLWFVLYLFLFSLIALPLFLYLKRETGRRFISKLAAFCEKPGTIFLFGLPPAAIESALRARYPGYQNLYNDWANVLTYMTVFIYGYIFFSDARIGQAIEKHGKSALVLGLACTLVAFALAFTGHAPAPDYSLGWILFVILRTFSAMFWLIAILSFAMKYLNFDNKLLRYANEAAYPFYILHQTVIVAIGFYVVRWNASVTAKYLAITTGSLVATVAVYDLLVRRTNVTRFLFGMKPKERGGANRK